MKRFFVKSNPNAKTIFIIFLKFTAKQYLCMSSWAEKRSQCDVFAIEPDHREGAKRDLLTKSCYPLVDPDATHRPTGFDFTSFRSGWHEGGTLLRVRLHFVPLRMTRGSIFERTIFALTCRNRRPQCLILLFYIQKINRILIIQSYFIFVNKGNQKIWMFIYINIYKNSKKFFKSHCKKTHFMI